MRTWTYAEAKDKVIVDLGIQEDSTIDQDELVQYFNDAIDEAEAEIRLSDKEEIYFKKSAFLSLVTSTSTYSLPADIYASKVLKVAYHNGSTIYPVKRIMKVSSELEIENITQSGSTNRYKYDLINTDATTGPQIVIYPTSRETSSSVMRLWYIRNANRIPTIADGSLATTDATVIDIPEFMTFIFAHVKVACLSKLPLGAQQLQAATLVLEKQRALMKATLGTGGKP